MQTVVDAKLRNYYQIAILKATIKGLTMKYSVILPLDCLAAR